MVDSINVVVVAIEDVKGIYPSRHEDGVAALIDSIFWELSCADYPYNPRWDVRVIGARSRVLIREAYAVAYAHYLPDQWAGARFDYLD